MVEPAGLEDKANSVDSMLNRELRYDSNMRVASLEVIEHLLDRGPSGSEGLGASIVRKPYRLVIVALGFEQFEVVREFFALVFVIIDNRETVWPYPPPP